MLNKTFETLTAEKFNEIYANEKFRNEVAYAHGYATKEGKLLGKKTCSFPNEYKVTDEQIAEAKAEIARAKKQTVKDNYGKLMLVGMGMTYEPRYVDDVCNHRVRAYIQNPQGQEFFLEVGTGQGENMRVDHAILKGEEDKNNYLGLERAEPIQYTLGNILRLVNIHFGCHFKEIVIDNYNVTTEDFVAISPEGGNGKAA